MRAITKEQLLMAMQTAGLSDHPVVIYDRDTKERSTIAAVSTDLDGNLTLILERS